MQRIRLACKAMDHSLECCATVYPKTRHLCAMTMQYVQNALNRCFGPIVMSEPNVTRAFLLQLNQNLTN
jgi:hypothetical protein